MWNFPTILNTEHRPQLKVRGLGSSWNLKSNYAGWGKGGGMGSEAFLWLFLHELWNMKLEFFWGEVVRPPPSPPHLDPCMYMYMYKRN